MDILQIIGTVIVTMFGSGGVFMVFLRGYNERLEIKTQAKVDQQGHEYKLKLADKEAERAEAQSEADTLRREHERELARLRADSDKDVLQAESQRQLVQLMQEQGQNNVKLAESIDNLAQAIIKSDEKAGDWQSKLNNHMSTTNIVLSSLPKEVAKAMSSSMREAMKSDLEKANDDLAFQIGTKLDELIAMAKNRDKVDKDLLKHIGDLKDVVDRALPVLQSISDKCDDEEEKDDKITELKQPKPDKEDKKESA